MRIALIEDETNIAHPIIRLLQKQNYAVDYAEDGKRGMDLVSVNNYDCIVLDLNLPQVDGLTIATFLRDNYPTTPILMLTARSQIYDKLTGFQSGADDYLTKPFDLRELLARINALIKRNSNNQDFTLKLGKLILNPQLNRVHTPDGEINLSNKETAVLEYLIRNQGRVISAEELLEHVWDSNVNSFSDTVKTHIKTLRKKLGEHGQLVTTIKGKGYLVNV